jgi:hypothetical protein
MSKSNVFSSFNKVLILILKTIIAKDMRKTTKTKSKQNIFEFISKNLFVLSKRKLEL